MVFYQMIEKYKYRCKGWLCVCVHVCVMYKHKYILQLCPLRGPYMQILDYKYYFQLKGIISFGKMAYSVARAVCLR